MASEAAVPRVHAGRGNNLLGALRASDRALLTPHLESIEAAAGDLIYNPGDNVDLVHFPCGASLASFLVTNIEERAVETVLVGREGAVGGIVSQGRLPAYCRIIVKHGGTFLRLRASELERAKLQSPSLRYLFARYADCLLAQVFQSVACNAVHTIEQRAAKWILAAMQRTGDHVVPLTHEQLAAMLGVGRSYTSRVIQTLKGEGILETRRGSLLVHDLAALEARSCRCNDAIREHFETVLAGVYPDAAGEDTDGAPPVARAG